MVWEEKGAGKRCGSLLKLKISVLKYKEVLGINDLVFIQHLTFNIQHFTLSSIINTSNASTPLGAYPHARKVGNLLFLSGIGPRNPADNSIPGLKLDGEGNILSYDIAAECHAVFANVKAVLEASGSSWDQMVDVTVFLTHMKKIFRYITKFMVNIFQVCRHAVQPWK